MKFKGIEWVEVRMKQYNDREVGTNTLLWFINGDNKYFLEKKKDRL